MIYNSHGLDTIAGKVVVVEDDDLIQRIIMELLSDMGGDCIAFVTADDALINLMQDDTKCALLVTDYSLAGQLNGRELAELVKDRWPSIPVVITSGYDKEVVRKLPQGVVYLHKPWTVAQMVEAVNFLIS